MMMRRTLFATLAAALSIHSAGAQFPFSFWKTVGAGAVPGSGSIYAAIYASDGDSNGVLYFAGTNFGAGSWTNPHTAGRVTGIESSDGDGGTGVLALVDRATNHYHTSNVANSWVALDLGSGRSLVVDKYSLRNYTTASFAIRNWKLQGSNSVATNDVTGVNAATWTDIDTRVADTTMANTASAWGTYTLGSVPAGYRWFRVLQNGLNANSSDWLTVAEIELYGTLTY